MPSIAPNMHPPRCVLTYHSLDRSGSVISINPAIFARHMDVLAELDASVLPLSDILNPSCCPNKPAIAITFDDGFQNLHEHAMPVLARHGFPATVFLVTDYCGRRNDWPSQPADIEHQPLLEWSQIAEMRAAGWDCGAHTRMHPDLRTLNLPALENEILGSKNALEDRLGSAVSTFAYPYGFYDDRTIDLVRRHFSLACSAVFDYLRPDTDPHLMERLDCYYFRRPEQMHRLFSPSGRAYVGIRGLLRKVRTGMNGRLRPPRVVTSPVQSDTEAACESR